MKIHTIEVSHDDTENIYDEDIDRIVNSSYYENIRDYKRSWNYIQKAFEEPPQEDKATRFDLMDMEE